MFGVRDIGASHIVPSNSTRTPGEEVVNKATGRENMLTEAC